MQANEIEVAGVPTANTDGVGLIERQQRIQSIAAAQLGCQPYESEREIRVARKFAGLPLLQFLLQYQPAVAALQWSKWIATGQITFDDQPVRPEMIVRDGQQFVHRQPNTVEPPINPQIHLLYEDEGLVVIDKPAPLPMHPCGRFNRNSLTEILARAYPGETLRLVHRLDADTTGVVVLCRTSSAAALVQQQFAEGSVTKQYLARVHGWPDWSAHTCCAAIESETAAGGSRRIAVTTNEATQERATCVTEFQIVQRFENETTLVAARPLSGRTNQIRVHLWHLGHAIVGDSVYLQGGMIGQFDVPLLQPLSLHAHQLSLRHPANKRLVTFTAPLPAWTQSTYLHSLTESST